MKTGKKRVMKHSFKVFTSHCLPWPPWGYHNAVPQSRRGGDAMPRERLDAQLSGVSISMQSMEGRAGCAQDISPGYLTYLVGIYGNIIFYSQPSNSSSHWFWQPSPDAIFSAHRYHMKVLKYFYLQHLCVPKKSIQEPLWPCTQWLHLVLNNSCNFHQQVSCHNPTTTDTVRWHQCHANYFTFIRGICRGDFQGQLFVPTSFLQWYQVAHKASLVH